MADKWEKMVDLSSKRLYEKRKQLQTVVGPRPYRGLPVSRAEQLQRFTQIRRDPTALADVLKENMKAKPDGRILVPRALVEAMIKMESKLRRGGFE